ncbi:ankyrin repeat domain-containing protein [Planctomycetota bacterium]
MHTIGIHICSINYALVSKYGRDTYGPKHTPLFVDGLNVHTHEPVKWISPKGDLSETTETEEWILSNFASQQTLLRTLDELSTLTGDPKYRDAAMQAIKYAFENLRLPSGQLYWGEGTAYDALSDVPCGGVLQESIKLHYPYYELMWKVDSEVTKKLIEMIWSAHVINWSNLDIDRLGFLNRDFKEPWNHEYIGGPTFFKSEKWWTCSNMITASSLIHGGVILNKLSRERQPLIWSKRLVKRFVDTRHPSTGISSLANNFSWMTHLGKDMNNHFKDPYTAIFPWDTFANSFRSYYPENAQAHPWLAIFLVGEMLGEEGRVFTQWALEELTAWGKSSYRKEDNCFVPMLTDGTSLEEYVWHDGPGESSGCNEVNLYPADLSFFWAYSLAYGRTGDEFMWEMVRDVAFGNGFGDIGQTPTSNPALQVGTACSHPYGIFGFLELYRKTNQPVYLEIARHIADNIIEQRFCNGFFVPNKGHIYTRFACFEAIALLRLEAVIQSHGEVVPQPWPCLPLFVHPYRYKIQGVDRHVIYELTESSEPPISLEEAAAIGDVDRIKQLIENGFRVEDFDSLSYMTPLHRAAMVGHKPVVELLLAEGAPINERDTELKTPLYYAISNGHKEIVELLIRKGADFNTTCSYVKDTGYAPLDVALGRGNVEIIKLLQDNGAEEKTIHAAVMLGDQAQVKVFLGQGININVKDDKGNTPLFYAIRGGHDELAQFLIDQGADINYTDKNGYGLLHYAIWYKRVAMIKVLASRGADVNLTPENAYSPLHYAIWNQDVNTVKILVDYGAQFNKKDPDGWTAFYNAVWQGSREIVDFLVSKGADISTFRMTAAMGDVAGVKTFLEQGLAVDTKDEMECTPLSWATCMGQVEVVKLLIAQGADVNLKLYGQATALQQAARVGNSDIVQLLITNGADVNAKTTRGLTPLNLAIRSGDAECIKLFSNNSDVNVSFISAVRQGDKESIEKLFDLGVDIDYQDNSGLTALNHAVISGNVSVVQLLLEHGAGVDVGDNAKRMPLHYAVVGEHKEIIAMLLKHGASVNVKDNAGRTPIHYAAGAAAPLNPQAGSIDIAKILLEKGANVNVQDKRGWTPLHHAAARLNKEIVAFLVSKGADLSIVDNRGDTVYSWNRARASFESRHAMHIPHEIINQYSEIAELLRVNNEAYVVAINGNDNNPGTLDKPFKTIAAALECVGPGNIIYIRGGIYHCEGSIRLDKSGARANPIWLKAYPGEKPIIDFSGVLGDSLFISGAYWHIKGLVIINGQRGVMVWGPGACHNVLEQITTYANGWGGILLRDGAAYNIILNCDSSKNFDPEFNGDTCDGFSAAFFLGQGNFFIGDRSWNNSDDGYDCWQAESELQFENCYAWDNGQNIWGHPFFFGNGNGFKLGQGGGRHVLVNCFAWGHHWGAAAGFTLNGNTSGVILYNCSAWENRRNFEFAGSAQEDCVFMNNISLDGERKDAVDRETISQSNNWDSATGVQLTDDDFLSLDDSMMSAPRNPDGSIPQNDFLKLAPGSTAIDKGADVGMPFVGARPDLGAFEYDPNETSAGYVKMLHQAVRDHDVMEIDKLLAVGEGINDKDWLGYTPLHWAVYFGYSDLIELLISKGADVNIQSDTGRYALEIARAMAYPELETLLRKLGANVGEANTNSETVATETLAF